VSAGQYFTEQPAVPSRRQHVSLVLPDLVLSLATDRGVFAADRVDPGTHLLLQEAPPPPVAGHLLDLGCGYGPIALTMARRSPAATVWAVDVNERALALCAENAHANGVSNVRAVRPGDVPPAVGFAAIWSNPPIRVGKTALHELLLQWLRRLEPSGTAVLVVQKHLGADSLARWLTAEALPTERQASRQGYRLLAVAPGSLPADGE
jgi:16S rRNA (guanine1207-N2)-methyltransferase